MRVIHRLCDMHAEQGRDGFPCPYCRGPTPIPEEGASGFPSTCPELETTADHVPLCQTHAGERLRFVCITCKTFLCVVCKSTAHHTHRTENLSTVASRCRRALEERYEPWLQRMVREQEGQLRAIAKDSEAAESRFGALCKRIAATVQGSEEETVAWRNQAKWQLLMEFREESSEHRRLSKKVQQERDRLSVLLARVKDAVQSETNPCRVVEIHKELLKMANEQLIESMISMS
nr:hypothetical protein BaRGS_010248 [Batillaria attramentaria]